MINNKGADQTRLVCACVVRKPWKTDFLTIMHVFIDEINSSIIPLPLIHNAYNTVAKGYFPEGKLLFTLGSFIRSHRFR